MTEINAQFADSPHKVLVVPSLNWHRQRPVPGLRVAHIEDDVFLKVVSNGLHNVIGRNKSDSTRSSRCRNRENKSCYGIIHRDRILHLLLRILRVVCRQGRSTLQIFLHETRQSDNLVGGFQREHEPTGVFRQRSVTVDALRVVAVSCCEEVNRNAEVYRQRFDILDVLLRGVFWGGVSEHVHGGARHWTVVESIHHSFECLLGTITSAIDFYIR